MIYIDLKDDLSEKMVYDYPDCPAYTIHEMLSHYPNYSAISHWHDDIEFLMIQSSSFGDISHLYAHQEPPSFAARFCETYDNKEQRHD